MTIQAFGRPQNLVDYVLTTAGLDILEATCKHLDAKAIYRLSRVAKSFNQAIQNYFATEMLKFNLRGVFQRASFVELPNHSNHRNLTNFNTSLKEKVRNYPADQLPTEIESLVTNESLLTPEQATQLTNFTQARDTLVTWSIIGRSIGVEEDMSAALKSYDAAIEKASGFSDWIGHNQAQLTNLKRLDLDDNQLTSLPPEIGQLTNLHQLDLYNNQLTSLPAEIGQLTNLRELSLGVIPRLRYEARRYGQTILGVASTAIAAYAAHSFGFFTLSDFEDAQELSLNNNQLTCVPAEIGQLTNL